MYAEYSGHAGVELDDVKLAVRAITAHSFTSPPRCATHSYVLQRPFGGRCCTVGVVRVCVCARARPRVCACVYVCMCMCMGGCLERTSWLRFQRSAHPPAHAHWCLCCAVLRGQPRGVHAVGADTAQPRGAQARARSPHAAPTAGPVHAHHAGLAGTNTGLARAAVFLTLRERKTGRA